MCSSDLGQHASDGPVEGLARMRLDLHGRILSGLNLAEVSFVDVGVQLQLVRAQQRQHRRVRLIAGQLARTLVHREHDTIERRAQCAPLELHVDASNDGARLDQLRLSGRDLRFEPRPRLIQRGFRVRKSRSCDPGGAQRRFVVL